MAEETPRSSNRVKKPFYKKSISTYPESPLGATPRPDLRQHYPDPPPSVELKTVILQREFTSGSVVNNDSNFTQLRKKTAEYTQVEKWNVDYTELQPEGSTKKAFLILALVFLTTLVALGITYSRFTRE